LRWLAYREANLACPEGGANKADGKSRAPHSASGPPWRGRKKAPRRDRTAGPKGAWEEGNARAGCIIAESGDSVNRRLARV